MRKACNKCGQEKPFSEFPRLARGKFGYDYYCKACRYALNELWRQNNLERDRAHGREYVERLRNDVITGYGSKCVCCGERNKVFLTLDHVNGGGRQHRIKDSLGPYRDARYRNYPPDYALLCMNCNWAKYILGHCSPEFHLK